MAAELPSLDPVHCFSQEAVDAQGPYLHSSPEVWSDTFSLDVSSGPGCSLEGVRLELEVLSSGHPLEAQNFSVPGGRSSHSWPRPAPHPGPYSPRPPASPPPAGAGALSWGPAEREEGPQDGAQRLPPGERYGQRPRVLPSSGGAKSGGVQGEEAGAHIYGAPHLTSFTGIEKRVSPFPSFFTLGEMTVLAPQKQRL